jgi:hypothetical protein
MAVATAVAVKKGGSPTSKILYREISIIHNSYIFFPIDSFYYSNAD